MPPRPQAAPITVLPATYPWWMPRQFRRRVKDYFSYGRDFIGANAVAAAGTVTLNINIDGDSAFLIEAGTRVVTLTDDTTFIAQAPLTVRMEDSGSGRLLANQAQHIENWFGTAQEPYWWAKPKLIPANSTIAITVANLDAATAFHVRLALHGFKVFNMLEEG